MGESVENAAGGARKQAVQEPGCVFWFFMVVCRTTKKKGVPEPCSVRG